MKTANEVVEYIKQVLSKIDRPAGPIELGGAYWRLAKALRYVDAHLEDTESADHAEFIRATHGRLEPFSLAANSQRRTA